MTGRATVIFGTCWSEHTKQAGIFPMRRKPFLKVKFFNV
jgi:hypothetical protein